MTEELRNDAPSAMKNAKIVYYLYLASFVVGITSIIGVVMAYIHVKDAPEWVKTHYRFQIRTFWIGFLYSFIAGILVLALIGYFLIVLVVIWIIVRCVKGLTYLDKKEPHPNPATWMF